MLLESALTDLPEPESRSVMESNNNSSAEDSHNENPAEEKPAMESENRDAVDNEDLTPKRLGEREKQISVDPQSLQNFCTPPGSVPFKWEMEPGVPKVKVRMPSFPGAPLQLPPARIALSKNRAPSTTSRLAGSSATASPRSVSRLMKNILKPKGKDTNNSDDYDDECANSSSPVSILYPFFERAELDSSLRVLARQRSLALARAVDPQYVAELRRARSCNVQTNVVSAAVRDDRVLTKLKSKRDNGNTSCRNGGTDNHDLFQYEHRRNNILGRADSFSRTGQQFTCGGICSFLPFVKQKAKQKSDDDVADTIDVPARIVTMRRQSSAQSLEKFDCGDSTPNSSASSMICADEEGGSRANPLYFERPNEIFVESSNEAFSPVAAAFVFDGDRRCPRSVLKKNNMSNKSRRSSRKSSMHVRFTVDPDGHLSSSDSCSSCNVTTRLRRAREEFNLYLAAETHNSP